MPKKFLVFELNDDEDLGEVVSFLASKTSKMAVVDSVPGVFSSYPAIPDAPSPQKSISRSVSPFQEEPEIDVEAADDAGISVEVKPGIAIIGSDLVGPELSFNDAGTSGEIQNTGEESKENHIQLVLDSMLNGEDAEFVDAVEAPELPAEYATMSKKRRRRMMERDDYDLYSTRRKARSTEETLFCGLCKSSMTLRASYGRTRLREHVLRHLNLPTAKCGLCDFTGVLREHIRRHHSMKHIGDKMSCVDLEMDDEFDGKFEALWKTCFPDTRSIPARSNAKRMNESGHDDKMDSDTASTSGHVPIPIHSKSIAETVEEMLRRTTENGLPSFNLFADQTDHQSEEDRVEIKPDVRLLNESGDGFPDMTA